MKAIWLFIVGVSGIIGLSVAAVFYAVISFGAEFIDRATDSLDRATIAIKNWLSYFADLFYLEEVPEQSRKFPYGEEYDEEEPE